MRIKNTFIFFGTFQKVLAIDGRSKVELRNYRFHAEHDWESKTSHSVMLDSLWLIEKIVKIYLDIIASLLSSTLLLKNQDIKFSN